MIDTQAQHSFCLSKLSELDGAKMILLFAVNGKIIMKQLNPLVDFNGDVVSRCLENRVMRLAHLPRLAAYHGG
jgi:hypothetical protein